MKALIEKLHKESCLSKSEFMDLIENRTKDDEQYLFSMARTASKKFFSNKIYVRGLIEFTNYCKNDCYYCGIRKSNINAERYRLSKEDILSCCEKGYELGFRTFVLQGGEDSWYTDERLCEIISSIRNMFTDCAITLSVGEKKHESYAKYFKAGANRYLLRHETANNKHYSLLHPDNLVSEKRKNCLYDLKSIGYQVGAGFMVGSPYQTTETIVEDLMFLSELQPHMVGIGPFIPHKDTPFAHFNQGGLSLTLVLIAITRLMLPSAMIPSTTALGTIDPKGRELGILSGANVVMPNLSPVSVRSKYLLYDNKICTGEEAAECRFCLQNRVNKIGYELVVDRGDFSLLDFLKRQERLIKHE